MCMVVNYVNVQRNRFNEGKSNMDFETIYKIVSFISSIFSAIAAGIAVYLFIFKRKSILSVFHLLLNYSFQISLTELRTKLERLNDLSANDEEQKEEVINIFNEIAGQIMGNSVLSKECGVILEKVSKYAENPQGLTEPKKRSIVSELRENLRNVDIQSYSEIIRR